MGTTSITKLWHDHDDHRVDGLLAWETATEFETVIFGSPRVREQVGRLVEVSGCNYVICAFAWAPCRMSKPAFSAAVAHEVMPAYSGDVRMST